MSRTIREEFKAPLGQREPALKWLRRPVKLGDANYPWFQRDKTYGKLRADPEYQSIMAGVRQRWETGRSSIWRTDFKDFRRRWMVNYYPEATVNLRPCGPATLRAESVPI